MRPIKFRAWIAHSSHMYYQDDQYLQSFLRRANMLYNVDQSGHDAYGVPPLMQFTGATDKNGKEIYEGDIVKFYGFESEPYFSTPQVIEFLNYGWHPFTRGVPAPHSMEVIGNIYENTELLK